MQKDRQLILAKIEATYGTDPTPTAADNSILASDIDIAPTGRSITRAHALAYMGAQKKLNIGESVRVRFRTEIKGKGGLADVPPEFGVLFKGCNFTETINAGTTVVYAPNSNISGNTSICLYAYQHDLQHKVLGARGTFKGVCTAGEYAYLEWEFVGLYAGPTTVSIPSPTFNSTTPPRFVSALFTFDSYSAVINQISFDIANRLAKRISANASTGIVEWLITNRDPKGSFDPEMVAIATYDFFSKVGSSAEVAISATVGSATGNKCVIGMPKVIGDWPAYADRENWLTLNHPFGIYPNAGNDELTFTFS